MSTLLSLMLVGVSLGQTPQPVQPFPDVPKTHWAYSAVTELHEKGILKGSSYVSMTWLLPSTVTELHEKGILKGCPGKYDRSTPHAAFQSLLQAINNGDKASIRKLMSSQLLESLHISSLDSQKRMAALKQASFSWKVRAANFSPGAWEEFDAKAATLPLGTKMEIRYFKGPDVIFCFVQDPLGWKVTQISTRDF
jgi:hypothetical protein